MTELPRPAEFELAILRVLWRRGQATVREVHEDLLLERQQGYTTVLKSMQIMLEKGLLAREEPGKTHVYRAAVPEQETQADLLKDLLFRAFGGSARKLVMAALKQVPSKEEAEIQALLESERERRKP
jgi:BlaI family transcriptional regulator, penicillinase repressor